MYNNMKLTTFEVYFY